MVYLIPDSVGYNCLKYKKWKEFQEKRTDHVACHTPNGPVHIGHLAGVYVPADIYVRYLRLKKEDVLFIGGSDEHGVPITIRAKKEVSRRRTW